MSCSIHYPFVHGKYTTWDEKKKGKLARLYARQLIVNYEFGEISSQTEAEQKLKRLILRRHLKIWCIILV